jgi:lipid-binding SYLF domain-containing protein
MKVMEKVLQKPMTVSSSSSSSSSPSTKTRIGKRMMGGIPLSYFEACAGIVILTCVETGLLISGCVGTGILLRKVSNKGCNMKQQHTKQSPPQQQNPTSSKHSWSLPVACGLTGFNFGVQGGATLKDVVVFLSDEKAVDAVLTGNGSLQVCVQSNFTLGKGREMDATVGVGVGEVFHTAATAPGPQNNHHTLNDTGDGKGHRRGATSVVNKSSAVAFSFTEGAFVGISLGGAVLRPRRKENETFYGQVGIKPKDIVLGRVSFPDRYSPTVRSFHDLLSFLDQAVSSSRSVRHTARPIVPPPTSRDEGSVDSDSSSQTVRQGVAMRAYSSPSGHSNHSQPRERGVLAKPLWPNVKNSNARSTREDEVRDERHSPKMTKRTSKLSSNDSRSTTAAVPLPPMVAIRTTAPSTSTATTSSAGSDRSRLIPPSDQYQQHIERRPEQRNDSSSSLYVNVDWHFYDKEQYL